MSGGCSREWQLLPFKHRAVRDRQWRAKHGGSCLVSSPMWLKYDNERTNTSAEHDNYPCRKPMLCSPMVLAGRLLRNRKRSPIALGIVDKRTISSDVTIFGRAKGMRNEKCYCRTPKSASSTDAEGRKSGCGIRKSLASIKH